MAFVLAPEAVEGAVAVGEEAVPAIEREAPVIEEKVEDSNFYRNSLRDLFLNRIQPAPSRIKRDPIPEPAPDPQEQQDEQKLENEATTLEQEQQQLNQMKAQPNPEPTFLDKINRYQQIFNHNMKVFNQQVETFGSLYQQSKNYNFNY